MLVETRNKNNLVGQAYPALPQTAPTLLLDIQTVVTGADPGPMYTYCRIRIFSNRLCYTNKERGNFFYLYVKKVDKKSVKYRPDL